MWGGGGAVENNQTTYRYKIVLAGCWRKPKCCDMENPIDHCCRKKPDILDMENAIDTLNNTLQ